MKNLIIIGAGGMGREIFSQAMLCKGFNSEYVIKGFIDDNKNALQGFAGYPNVIDTVTNYIPEADDVFICSMRNVIEKKRSIQIILGKGGEFINLIHTEAYIGKNVKIGKGWIVLKDVHIGVDCTINDHVLIQNSAVIGYDVKIGKYTRVDCHVVCVGGIELKDEVTVHSNAVINQHVIVEKGAIVGALSFVIRKVNENTTVIGNPARKL